MQGQRKSGWLEPPRVCCAVSTPQESPTAAEAGLQRQLGLQPFTAVKQVLQAAAGTGMEGGLFTSGDLRVMLEASFLPCLPAGVPRLPRPPGMLLCLDPSGNFWLVVVHNPGALTTQKAGLAALLGVIGVEGGASALRCWRTAKGCCTLVCTAAHTLVGGSVHQLAGMLHAALFGGIQETCRVPVSTLRCSYSNK